MSGKILLAESAGFCYGVRRAVELAKKTAGEQGNCWMLGDLIHNTQVVEELAARGIRKTADADSLGQGDTVIIRSHGELKNVLLVSTGALLSTISTQQGESIPGIAHAVAVSTEKDSA